jgi:hypothetical protein
VRPIARSPTCGRSTSCPASAASAPPTAAECVAFASRAIYCIYSDLFFASAAVDSRSVEGRNEERAEIARGQRYAWKIYECIPYTPLRFVSSLWCNNTAESLAHQKPAIERFRLRG